MANNNMFYNNDSQRYPREDGSVIEGNGPNTTAINLAQLSSDRRRIHKLL